MKQSKLMSFAETFLSTIIGLAVALATQIIVFPWFGFHPTISDNLLITGIFTVVSIARQYLVRRLFEALHIRRPLSPFMQAVIAERYRQIEGEGWSAEHDDKEHATGELAQAGASYALYSARQFHNSRMSPAGDVYTLKPLPHAEVWPWSDTWWKPVDFRRNIVKAAALIMAEGERFDRQRKRRLLPEEPCDVPMPSVKPTMGARPAQRRV